MCEVGLRVYGLKIFFRQRGIVSRARFGFGLDLIWAPDGSVGNEGI